MKIDRNPTTPKLTRKAKALITDLCFRKNDALKKVDGIFVYASLIGIEELANLLKKILEENIAKKVFITGGVTPKVLACDLNVKAKLTEADLILNSIDTKKFKDIRFYVEKKSTNTMENVTETWKNPEFRKCKSLLFIFKSHAAGRGYLTIKKYFPAINIIQQSFDTKYAGASKKITRNNWHTFPFGMTRVWGEFLRIREYGSRGDIEYDSIRDLVIKIEKEIQNEK